MESGCYQLLRGAVFFLTSSCKMNCSPNQLMTRKYLEKEQTVRRKGLEEWLCAVESFCFLGLLPGTLEQQNRLPIKVVESLSLEILKTHLNVLLCNLLQRTCFSMGMAQVIPRVPPAPMILQFCIFLCLSQPWLISDISILPGFLPIPMLCRRHLPSCQPAQKAANATLFSIGLSCSSLSLLFLNRTGKKYSERR